MVELQPLHISAKLVHFSSGRSVSISKVHQHTWLWMHAINVTERSVPAPWAQLVRKGGCGWRKFSALESLYLICCQSYLELPGCTAQSWRDETQLLHCGKAPCHTDLRWQTTLWHWRSSNLSFCHTSLVMKFQQGHEGVFLNMKDTVGCRMVVGGENSSGSKPRNRKAGLHREHSSFSHVCVIGMETTDILHQLVPPTRLPETYMMSHQCLLNTQAKNIVHFLFI